VHDGENEREGRDVKPKVIEIIIDIAFFIVTTSLAGVPLWMLGQFFLD
jgi:hypothetical protein